MSDLPSGRYGKTSPLWALLGQATNQVDATQPVRTNLEWGFGNPSDGALASTGVGCVVAVPVDPGQYISTVSVPIGATAGATMTHQFVALYSGIATPALIGQSTDTTNAAIGASGLASWNLTVVQQITAAQAPNGFIYVEIAITASTIPTAVSFAVPTGTQYQWMSSSTTPKGASPLVISGTSGSALAGTAGATLTLTAKAVAPVVILS